MRTRRSQFSSDPVSSKGHQPVLLHEVLEQLAIKPDDCVVDATLGGAGHARAIADRLDESGMLIGFDLDYAAIERAQKSLSGARPRIILIEANFRNLESELRNRGITRITKALLDLGMSSSQLDSGLSGQGRGFSFLRDEPLRMTFSAAQSDLDAATIVNEWREESIADVIHGFGGERYSRRIAKAIVERRDIKPFETARELAETISAAVSATYRRGRIHPATRTFQALRIAVNDEFGALEDGIRGAWGMLATGGRIAIISFHSIEDGIVKRAFAELERSGLGKRITRKPIVAGREETKVNPRARSAKLRVIEKI